MPKGLARTESLRKRGVWGIAKLASGPHTLEAEPPAGYAERARKDGILAEKKRLEQPG